jgi:hypothetical protein
LPEPFVLPGAMGQRLMGVRMTSASGRSRACHLLLGTSTRLLAFCAVFVALGTGCTASGRAGESAKVPNHGCLDLRWMNAGNAPRAVSAMARTLTTATSDGFYFLSSKRRQATALVCAPEAFVLENLEDLQQAERDLDWRFGNFEVDFSTHVVFAYTLPKDYCQRFNEPLALRLRTDGRLEPQQPTTLQIDCSHVNLHAYSTNLVAIARVSLPERGFSFQHLDGHVSFFAFRHPIGRRPPVPESLARHNFAISGEVLGTFALPARGDTQAVRLVDGRPIWLVHHENGSVSALDARIDLSSSSGLRGLALAVRWDSAARRFDYALDEYGGAGVYESDLKRFELEVDARTGTVRVGRHATAEKRRVKQHLVQPATRNYGEDDYERKWAWVSLEEALVAPDGSTVLVNAGVVLDPKRPARLCRAGLDQREPRCVALSPDIRPQDGYGMRFMAPTFVVVRNGKFTEPMVTDMRGGPM